MNRSKDTTRAASSIPLPIALLLCAIFAVTTWAILNLPSADNASAAGEKTVQDLYVGSTHIYEDEVYTAPSTPPCRNNV